MRVQKMHFTRGASPTVSSCTAGGSRAQVYYSMSPLSLPMLKFSIIGQLRPLLPARSFDETKRSLPTPAPSPAPAQVRMRLIGTLRKAGFRWYSEYAPGAMIPSRCCLKAVQSVDGSTSQCGYCAYSDVSLTPSQWPFPSEQTYMITSSSELPLLLQSRGRNSSRGSITAS